MRLFIIRHGQTEWNSSYRLQGRTDIPLNENGRDLARKTGEALARLEIRFDRIYSSPLSRACETAKLVAAKMVAADAKLTETNTKLAAVKAMPAGNQSEDYEAASALNGRTGVIKTVRRFVPIITDARLLEISFGEMEGERVRDENGVLNVDNYICFFNDPERYVPPESGESFQELIARTGDFLEERREEALRAEYLDEKCLDAGHPGSEQLNAQGKPSVKEQNILISTHGAASRALLANITHCKLREYWSGGVPKNCAVTTVELVNGTWEITDQDRIFY